MTTRVSYHRAGTPDIADLEPGDFILTQGVDFYARLIRFGQRLRFSGKRKTFAQWNHAALVSERGGFKLVEALSQGVVRSDISKYRDTEYVAVRVSAELLDQNEIISFANLMVGESYGWTTIVCIAIGLLTGGKFTFGFQGQSICSGLVARALERKGEWFERLAEDVMPADLAEHFGVTV